VSNAACRATSITHQHILAVIVTELKHRRTEGPVRILDVGCGNGKLIAFLHSNLPILLPFLTFELHGFDVNDHGVQKTGYFDSTISDLTSAFPEVPWIERLRVISSDSAWPYPREAFDVIISNQVLEHIQDPNFFFSEIYRVLRFQGFSAHLFPLKHYIYEGHLLLPYVHRILNHDLLVAYINFLSLLGLGKYKEHRAATGVSRHAFSLAHADYMAFFTHYLSYSELLRLGKIAGLRTSFRYTLEFYTSKLRQIFRMVPRMEYRRPQSAVTEWMKIAVLRYLSGITLFLEKDEVYTSSPGRSAH
jgi:SAM-dependent methyltransferase